MRYIKFYSIILILAVFAFSSCSDLKDNLSAPETVSIHGKDVQNSDAEKFHGRILTSSGMNQCRECHSRDLSGGTAKVSCSAVCHKGIVVHKDGIIDPSSPNFHAKYIKDQVWDLSLCSQCHGETYSGGIASPSCNTCHSNPNGPESCNTCHGNFDDPNFPAPPRALTGAVAVTDPKVGAHSYHMYAATLNGKNAVCSDCHIVPAKLTSEGHIGNDGKAEVVFSTSKTGIGSPAGSYSFTNNKCTNTYCHGNFELSKSTSQFQFIYNAGKMSGIKNDVTWNKQTNVPIQCGSCHDLPPTGHVGYLINTCQVCHQGVIDKEGKIINKNLHMNGKVNVFDLEY